MAGDILEGRPAPDFTLEAVPEGTVTLSSFRGRPVVLYFYPKDDTPGCTREACAFRDARDRLQEAGAVVLGVSRDSVASHGRFHRKHGLDFPLLSDTEGKVTEAYGVWREKRRCGRTSFGIERSTFLIDGSGVIRKVWRGVQVDGHDQEVLEALQAL